MRDESSSYTRRHGRPRGVTGGLILIALGVVFLLQQWGRFDLQNWWAIFILIPALGSFGSTYALYQRTGSFNRAAVGNFFGALMILSVALIFLFNLEWAAFWPLFILLPGLSLLATGMPFDGYDTLRHRELETLVRPWTMGVGLGATLLGMGFLATTLWGYDPAAILPHWWGLPILCAAAGGLIAALLLYRAEGRLGWLTMGNLAAALVVAVVGVVALLGVDWNLLWPIILIATGCVVLLAAFRRPGVEG